VEKEFWEQIAGDVVSRQDRLCDPVYFYGSPDAAAPVPDRIARRYQRAYPDALVIRQKASGFFKETFRAAWRQIPQ